MLQYFDPRTKVHPDKDYGTPAISLASSTEQVNLTIDGQAVSVPVGTSIMRAAALAGINIPKLSRLYWIIIITNTKASCFKSSR